jgi:hypothetical protein
MSRGKALGARAAAGVETVASLAAVLSALLLGACESGDSPHASRQGDVAASPVTGDGARPNGADPSAKAPTEGNANEGAVSEGAVSEGAGTEGTVTNDVALDTAAAGGSAAADAGVPDGGSPTSSDAGLAGDAGAADAAPPPSNDCCGTSGSGGCNDPVVSACVCEGDPACCDAEYDDICVNQAVSRCGQRCDERAPVSDCCSPSDVPGCTVPEVADCICAIDPFCCVFRFDQNCVNLGLSQCNAVCGEEAQP